MADFVKPPRPDGYHFYGCPAWRGGECCCKKAVEAFLTSKNIPIMGAVVETKVVTTITQVFPKSSPKTSPKDPKKEKKEKLKKAKAALPPTLSCAVIGGPGMLTKRYSSEGERIRWRVVHYERSLNGSSISHYDLVVVMVNNVSHQLTKLAEKKFSGMEFVYQPNHGCSELMSLLETYRQRLS